MNELIIVNSNNNAIAKWVSANPKYLPSVVHAGNKQYFNLRAVTNQVGSTTIAKQTTSTDNSIGFYTENGEGNDGTNNVSLDSSNGMAGNYVGSNVELNATGNLEKRLFI